MLNGKFIKATVCGKKAGFVVYNGDMWLLSYCRGWDTPSAPDYDDVPKHGFHRCMKIEVGVLSYSSWQDWRSANNYSTLSSERIFFPGEQGFEREIRRRRCNRGEANSTTTAENEAQTATSNEGNGIDFYLPKYTTTNVYEGVNSYHASHCSGYLNQPNVPFTGHRIGIELEVEGNSSNCYYDISSKKSNWFTRERDGSLGCNGIEFITIPLLPSDAKSYETWMPLCDYLKTRAKSWDTGRCGLHVHIGREILGDTEEEQQLTLGKLLIFYQGDIEDWSNAIAVFGRDRCYHQPDGDTEEIKAVKCLGKAVLKDADVFNQVDAAMKRRFGSQRYFAVNLTNSHTIEFRKGRGSINADRIIAVVTFVEAICLFCRSTNAHELTLDNFKQYLFHNVPCGNPVYRYLNMTQQDS